jgi:hypothetical protein
MSSSFAENGGSSAAARPSHLEPIDRLATQRRQGASRQQQPQALLRRQARLATKAAACAVHGCVDGEDAAIEYERWDGMS